MDPARKAARRGEPGAYMSKGVDPQGSGVKQAREHRRAEVFYRNPGMVSPGEQRGVPNNPRNVDSLALQPSTQVYSNPYGDWRAEYPTSPMPQEAPPLPPAVKLMAPPWQANDALDLQNGVETLAMRMAHHGQSPVHQAPNEHVLNNRPIARPGISGYEGMPLPPGPLDDMSDLALPVQAGRAPLPTGMELDPRFAPYSVEGDPALARFPSMDRSFKGGRGKPSSLPT